MNKKEIKWQKQGNGYIGDKIVEVRTLKIPDEMDIIRRYRSCTVFKDTGSFSSVPAQGRLFKHENGYIGALITGRNEGYVKVGKNFFLQHRVIVGFNALSKKVLKSLIHKTNIEIIEIDGIIVGQEK